ncbi:MFS transporter [Paraburkholderia sp. C35]|uniref:MFS transporter n=1 Tax=Paraburkholderia sp. C35 TaxID=2126993 RepID=UPI000D69DF6A|nr:MFS transporter [Paraburkholderia sp. C35]
MTSHAPIPPRSRAAFWTAACVIVQTLWTSAAPAMSYAWYAHAWHIGNTTISAIFAAYPVVVALTLLGLGGMSDAIGRRTTLLLGLAASIAGVASFALAQSVVALFVGRLFMGLGVGLAAGPASAALLDHAPAGDRSFASAINTCAQAFGLAAAAIAGGALIEYAPDPAHGTFRLLLLLLAALFAACWVCLPRTERVVSTPTKLRTARLSRTTRAIALRAAPPVMSAFIVGTVMLSLGAQIARELVHSQNMLVNGVVIASFAIVWGVTSLVAKGAHRHRAIRAGSTAACASMLLLAVAAQVHSLLFLILSVVAAGVGYALLFLSGLALVSEHIDDQHKALSLSLLYFAGYAMQGMTALALGMAASHVGLREAVTYGAMAISVLCALTGFTAGPLATAAGDNAPRQPDDRRAA